MIRTRTSVNTRQLDALNRNMQNFEQLVVDAMENAARVAGEPALNELQETPGPSKHPFVWSNNREANRRARAWYFAAIARGEIPTDGERYQRSGQLANAWQYYVVRGNNGASFILENPTRRGRTSIAKYVYGGFGPNGYDQIPGHRRTGWPEADPIAQAAQARFIQELRERVPRLMMNGVIRQVNR